jgi:hypothetical protein
VPGRADIRVRDPDQEEGVSPEHEAPPVRPPQAAARRDDRAEVLRTDPVAGLLGQLADGRRPDGLAAVQPAAGRQPGAAASVAEPEEQHPLARVKDKQPGGGPEARGGRHAPDATGPRPLADRWFVAIKARERKRASDRRWLAVRRLA